VLDLSGVGAFTSYFVICTGFSTPQVQAICTEIEEQLYKEQGRSPEHREDVARPNGRLRTVLHRPAREEGLPDGRFLVQ